MLLVKWKTEPSACSKAMRTGTEASAANARWASAAGRKPGSKGGARRGFRSRNASVLTRGIEPLFGPRGKNPLRARLPTTWEGWVVGHFGKEDSAGAPNPTREGACAPRKTGKWPATEG